MHVPKCKWWCQEFCELCSYLSVVEVFIDKAVCEWLFHSQGEFCCFLNVSTLTVI